MQRNLFQRWLQNWFSRKGLPQIDPPLLVPVPGMESNLDAFEVPTSLGKRFLPTSPEFSLKKYLAWNLEASSRGCFAITHAFRKDPNTEIHQEEFTMLEWYRIYFDRMMLEQEVLELINHAIKDFQGVSNHHWIHYTVDDLLIKAGLIELKQLSDLSSMKQELRKKSVSFSENDTWDDLFTRVWIEKIEPQLQSGKYVVSLFPASQRALAQASKEKPWLCERFEIIWDGIELANGFWEEQSPQVLKETYDKETSKRIVRGATPWPFDQELADASAKMLPMSGVAVGVDRLWMLLMGKKNISTSWSD